MKHRSNDSLRLPQMQFHAAFGAWKLGSPAIVEHCDNLGYQNDMVLMSGCACRLGSEDYT